MRKRLALAIGVGKYQHIGRLTGTATDAIRMEAGLSKKCSFEVELCHDQREEREAGTRKTIIQSISAFQNKLKENKDCLAILFYSGHGASNGEKHYMLANDYNPEFGLGMEGICIEDVLDSMREHAGTVIAILDMCRSPAKGVGERDQGLWTKTPFALKRNFQALKHSPPVLICWACSPYEVAQAGQFSSVYTRALAKYMFDPKYAVHQAASSAAHELELIGQQPRVEAIGNYDYVDRDLWLVPGGTARATAPPQPRAEPARHPALRFRVWYETTQLTEAQTSAAQNFFNLYLYLEQLGGEAIREVLAELHPTFSVRSAPLGTNEQGWWVLHLKAWGVFATQLTVITCSGGQCRFDFDMCTRRQGKPEALEFSS